MVEPEIYAAFAQAVADFAVVQSPPIVASVAYPGVHFVPPTAPDALWLECQFLPNATQSYGVANDGPKVHRGIFQVKACTREGRGTLPALSLAADVIAWFAMGTVLPFGAPVVAVRQEPTMAPPLEYDDRIEVPVSVGYFRAA